MGQHRRPCWPRQPATVIYCILYQLASLQILYIGVIYVQRLCLFKAKKRIKRTSKPQKSKYRTPRLKKRFARTEAGAQPNVIAGKFLQISSYVTPRQLSCKTINHKKHVHMLSLSLQTTEWKKKNNLVMWEYMLILELKDP